MPSIGCLVLISGVFGAAAGSAHTARPAPASASVPGAGTGLRQSALLNELNWPLPTLNCACARRRSNLQNHK
jgi:hypothetical protein